MKKFKLLLAALQLLSAGSFAQVAVNSDGSAADASAMLDVVSTSKGMLVPRMTATQRTAISTPATGLLVHQTDGTAGFYYYSDSAWTLIGKSSDASQWTSSGSDIYYNSGNVGIGTTTPCTKLHVDNGALYVHGIDNTASNYTLLLLNQNTDNMMVVYNDNTTYMIGNVGIGTSAPIYKLDISSADATAIRLGPNATYARSLFLGGWTTTDFSEARIQTSTGNLHLDAKSGNAIYLNNYHTGNVYLASAGGNVGVGMGAASQKLDVAGNIKITNQTGAIATPDKIDLGMSWSNGTTSGGANSSDRRLKRDILPLSKYGLH